MRSIASSQDVIVIFILWFPAFPCWQLSRTLGPNTLILATLAAAPAGNKKAECWKKLGKERNKLPVVHEAIVAYLGNTSSAISRLACLFSSGRETVLVLLRKMDAAIPGWCRTRQLDRYLYLPTPPSHSPKGIIPSCLNADFFPCKNFQFPCLKDLNCWYYHWFSYPSVLEQSARLRDR